MCAAFRNQMFLKVLAKIWEETETSNNQIFNLKATVNRYYRGCARKRLQLRNTVYFKQFTYLPILNRITIQQ